MAADPNDREELDREEQDRIAQEIIDRIAELALPLPPKDEEDEE